MLTNTYWAMEPLAFTRFQAAIGAGDVRRAAADEADLSGPGVPGPEAGRIGARSTQEELPLSIEGGVATIPIGGVMLKRSGWFSALFGMASTVAIRAAIRAAVADPDVGAIMLLIDSPGGVADGLVELADEIHEAKLVKPVVAQVDGVAASAAYFAASQASAIYAHPMDTIGCIGTRILFFDEHKAFENEGVEAVAIDTAPKERPFKSMGAPGTEITKQHRAEIQRMIDELGASFKAAVVRGREPMTASDVDAVADGRVWHAGDALRLGLIDGIQTTERTIASLRGQVADRAAGRDRMARARVAGMERG